MSLDLNGTEKAAVVILSLEPDDARTFLDQMADEEVEQLMQAVARIESVPSETREEVLREFAETLLEQGGAITGGRDRALSLIDTVLDSGRAGRIRESLGVDELSLSAALRGFSPVFLADALAVEHPQTIALVLSQVPAQRGASVIAELPDELRADVVLRLAGLEAVSPKVIRDLQECVADMFGCTPGHAAQVGGREAAARLLNRVGKESGAGILEKVDERDAALAQEIRKRMLTFNDLVGLDDRAFQQLLREVASEDLVVSLKTASAQMTEKVFKNVSSRAADQIREDGDLLGPMKLSEVEAVQERVVEAARRLEEQGSISLDFGEGDDVLV